MKTIAYKDRAGGGMKLYNPPVEWKQNKLTEPYNLPVHLKRILQGLKELEGVGNINIYLIQGNKIRLIRRKGL